MPNYRRPFYPGGMFFFTVVTERRRALFSQRPARRHLHDAVEKVRAERPFDLVATVLLPEHLHSIWQLPEDDTDFSARWSCIKRYFTQAHLASGASEAPVSASRGRHRERGLWQRRFWDHRIRNEDDMIHHVNYIHYNPVKHGLVRCPHAWPWSSFHRWVGRHVYPPDWACATDPPPDFGGISDKVGE